MNKRKLQVQIPLFHHIKKLSPMYVSNLFPAIYPFLFLFPPLFSHSPLLTSHSSDQWFVFQKDHYRKLKNGYRDEIMYGGFAPDYNSVL